MFSSFVSGWILKIMHQMVEQFPIVSVLFYDIYVIIQFNFQGNEMETSLLLPKQKTDVEILTVPLTGNLYYLLILSV